MPHQTSPAGAARGRVVLGTDGSAASIAALRWAINQARARSWPLEIVTCWPDPEELFVHEVPGHFCVPRHRAVLNQQRALDAVREDCAGIEVVTVVENAHPVDALVSRCSADDLLVVGASRGGSGRSGPSVDQLCSILAMCQVVVVEPTTVPMAG